MNEEISIDWVAPETLQPNPWNPNRVSSINMEKIVESLRGKKFFKPVLVREKDGELEIIGGEHRVLASITLGTDRIPIINQGPLSDSEAKLMSIQDNARYGEDDNDAMSALFAEGVMGSAEDLISVLPYDETDLAGFMEHVVPDLSSLDDDLDLDTGIDFDLDTAPISKTSQIVRFKLQLEDADRISELINKTKAEQGFTDGDDLSNAGDALVYLLLENK